MGKIIELLEKRVSARRFQDKSVPGYVLEEILQAGRLSPSGGNEQPWRFEVVNEPALISRIAQIAHRQEWLARSPLLIVLCTVCVDDSRGGRDIQVHRYPEHARAIIDMDQDLYWALNQEEHQTKIPGTHMLLAALEHGVSACWVSRFEVRALACLLGLPDNVLPSEILAFGYPEHQQKPVSKKNLEEIVFYHIESST